MIKGKHTFTAQIEKDPETNLYTGYIPALPGAHTQAASLDELHKNLEESGGTMPRRTYRTRVVKNPIRIHRNTSVIHFTLKKTNYKQFFCELFVYKL